MACAWSWLVSHPEASGGVYEKVLEFTDCPVRVVSVNRAWAELVASEDSAFWRVLLRRVAVVHGGYASWDVEANDVAKCGASSWRQRYVDASRRRGVGRFRVSTACRFRPVVSDAGGDDKFAAPRVLVPLHQRVAMLREKQGLSSREALRRVGRILADRDTAGAEENAVGVRASIVHVDSARGSVLTLAPGSGLRAFGFETVLDEAAGQRESYDKVARDLVEDVLKGRNATLFAFGQTGSGKSHSVFGGDDATREGLVPRCLDEMFACVRRRPRHKFGPMTLSMTCVEVDGDDVIDLYAGVPVARSNAAARGYVLGGRVAVELPDLAAAKVALSRCRQRRKRAATAMNARSSRAHALVILTVAQKLPHAASTSSSSFFIADLGGSEQLKRSVLASTSSSSSSSSTSSSSSSSSPPQAADERLIEAKNINLGLFALKRCVSALRRGQSAPFASSKLTQLLRNGLCGDSKTRILVCGAPEPSNAAQTVAALRFAEQCAGLETEFVASKADARHALRSTLDAIDAEVARLEALVKAKERWATRTRTVQSSVPTLEGFKDDDWGAGLVKVRGSDGKLKWQRPSEFADADAGVFTHVVTGKYLTGAEAERAQLEALLARKAHILASL